MAFHVKVKPLATEEMRQKLGDLSSAEHAVAERLEGIAGPYVPFRTGVLANSAVVNGNVLSYSSAAVQILYRGVRSGKSMDISKAQNPQAQSHWVYGAQKDHQSSLRQFAADEILRELKK